TAQEFLVGRRFAAVLRPLFLRPRHVSWKFVRGRGPNEQIQRDFTSVPAIDRGEERRSRPAETLRRSWRSGCALTYQVAATRQWHCA
ncbi:hypothetical protein PMAYCL1PPCAC_20044, partial [Pristionchus mayeri]